MTADQLQSLDGSPARHPLTVREFLILDEAGAFEELGHVELVEGEIYVLSPIHRAHSRTQTVLIAELEMATRRVPAVQATANVSAELDLHNLPEPDAAVLRDNGGEGFATPDDVMIVIEVSVSSLRHDLNRKAKLYARAGIPEYWVVDVTGRQIHRLCAPDGERYAQADVIAFGETLQSATIPEIAIPTDRFA